MNKAAEKGNTALMFAFKANAEALLKAGADVNTTNLEGKTALMCNIEVGHYDTGCAETLLKLGANVNIVDNNGYTAIVKAVLDDNVKCAKLLIEAGADLNSTDDSGDTALFLAAANGHTECAKLLVEAGAAVKSIGNAGVDVNTSYSTTEINVQCSREGADVNTNAVVEVGTQCSQEAGVNTSTTADVGVQCSQEAGVNTGTATGLGTQCSQEAGVNTGTAAEVDNNLSSVENNDKVPSQDTRRCIASGSEERKRKRSYSMDDTGNGDKVKK